MIDRSYIETMARYNAWQNSNLYGAASTLSDEARRSDRGSFFRSIHGTLSHLIWGDTVWLARFQSLELPNVRIEDSPGFMASWDEMVSARRALDQRISEFATTVSDAWLAGTMTWFSGATGREVTKSHQLLVTHMFNHQTHHRGQVHAMLTAAGARPTATDLPFMPEAL